MEEQKKEGLSALQECVHFSQGDDTNERVKRTLTLKQFIGLGFAMVVLLTAGGVFGGLYVYKSGPGFLGLVPKSYGDVSYSQMLAAARVPDRTEIWFDRQHRVHGNSKFAAVDKKFPAQYEIWEGGTLIERWHWRVESDPRTHIWGDSISRCVIAFRDKDHSGFTTTIMADFPGETNNPKPNSVATKITHDTGTLSLWSLNDDCTPHGLRVTWCMGELASVEHMVDGVPVDKRGDCGSSSLAEMWEAENAGRFNSEHLLTISKHFPCVLQLLGTSVTAEVKTNK